MGGRRCRCSIESLVSLVDTQSTKSRAVHRASSADIGWRANSSLMAFHAALTTWMAGVGSWEARRISALHLVSPLLRSDAVDVQFALFFDCSEAVMEA